MEPIGSIRVEVVAVSAGSCAGKPTWETATHLLRSQLERRFGGSVTVEYVELFSPRSFDLPEMLMKGIGDESLRLPVVLVNDHVVSSGVKLNEGLLARRIEEILRHNKPANCG
jgi:disulfide oxidoreductase YuzD